MRISDWSSDVCSSDLSSKVLPLASVMRIHDLPVKFTCRRPLAGAAVTGTAASLAAATLVVSAGRSDAFAAAAGTGGISPSCVAAAASATSCVAPATGLCPPGPTRVGLPLPADGPPGPPGSPPPGAHAVQNRQHLL